MTISESTLESWTNQGSTENSKRTYRSVNTAIKNERYGLESDDFEHSYDVHLQGSYANHTNIYGDSDVDVVVRITMPFQEYLEALSQTEKQRFWNKYDDIDYEYWDFHSRVLHSLNNHYGYSNVTAGNKAIKIEATDDTAIPIDADVVACADFRYYHGVDKNGSENYTTGMYFETGHTRRDIVNYSQLHRKHGSEKNHACNNRYKPTVRMFKNANSHMVDKNIIDEDTSSSYYLEGLLYNVPNNLIDQSSLQNRYTEIVSWLEGIDVAAFDEQSEMYPLCVDNDPDRWKTSKADETIDGFGTLWDS